ncbi:hypothetical protein [Xanthomonas sp. NCPPB 2632]|uniref:hypothetical protein n=1 Tax=Xanthomonas sp. NCPPB 2632 TaxID=3240912 RepID=UPI003513FC26
MNTVNDIESLSMVLAEARALLAELREQLAASREQREAQERLMKEAARLSASFVPMLKPSASQPHTSTDSSRRRWTEAPE